MLNQQRLGTSDPLPFDTYPGNGRELLPLAKGDNCRHGYGLNHQRITGQTSCAYCPRDFTAAYSDWLMMALDHVIPASVCVTMYLDKKWADSHSNRVLCCSACNGFRNRWKPKTPLVCPATEAEFFDMRDAVFMARREEVRKRAAAERAFFDSKPWKEK